MDSGTLAIGVLAYLAGAALVLLGAIAIQLRAQREGRAPCAGRFLSRRLAVATIVVVTATTIPSRAQGDDAIGRDAASLASRLDDRPPRLPAAGGRGQQGPPGRRKAFRLLFSPATIKVVWRWLERLGVTLRDREDVSQDAFLAAHRALPGYDRRRGTPLRWLNGIVVYTVAAYRRRPHLAREQLHQDVDPPEQADPTADAYELLRRDEDRRHLLAALETMDAGPRAILIAHDLEGLPMPDVAARLGIPLSTAYKRRARAMAAIRAAFA